MTLAEKFKKHLTQFSFIQKKQPQLLAVSGGVDSVVLCHLLHNAGYDFMMAHCNFQLRGRESDRDEEFVYELGVKYGKKVLLQRFDTTYFASAKKLSMQVAARELRYNWFRNIINREGGEENDLRNAYILTAHHADDNIETVAINFFRGTGLKGLTGMDNEFNKILRPLLPFRKTEIIAFAKENDLCYVEDSSNANSYYTRNFFRNELLPSVKKIFPQAEENILKNMQRLSEANEIYEHAIAQYKAKLVEIKGSEAHIAILKLCKQAGFKTILWEILKEKLFTSPQVDEVLKLLHAANGSYVQSAAWRVIRSRRWLVITPLPAAATVCHIVIDKAYTAVTFAGGTLHFSTVANSDKLISPDRNTATIDAGLLTFPLLLRKWKQGDYFYPLGMQSKTSGRVGKKKISRFLTDQKVLPTDRDNTWVLESDKKIAWIINYRLDDRFKVKQATNEVVRIVYKQ